MRKEVPISCTNISFEIGKIRIASSPSGNDASSRR